MEDFRYLKTVTLFFAGTLLVFPLFVFAYSNKTTHPALTSEIVELFNTTYLSLTLKDTEKALLMRGSTEEDAGARPLQHFFDPVYNRGLTIAGNEWMKAPKWAEGTLAQASYAGNLAKIPGISALYGTAYEVYSADTDYSWERAIYDYAWGDKERGLLALGHILHLLEDMAVPDHTRNDPHPEFAEAAFGGPSPYESFASQFTPDTISLKTSDDVPQYDSLEKYISNVAKYSNNNFFSKDSFNRDLYSEPNIETVDLEYEKNRQFGIGLIGKEKYKLFVIKKDGFDTIGEYFVKDPDNLILSDYWRLLSREAVSHGAGVVKLFFDEVAKERETKMLALKNRNWAQKMYDKTASAIYGIAGKLYGTSVPYEELNKPGTETVRLKTGGMPQSASVAAVENSRQGLALRSEAGKGLTLAQSFPQQTQGDPARSGLPLPAHTESVDSQRVRPDLAPFDPVQNDEASSVLNGASEALYNSTPTPYVAGFGGGGTPPPVPPPPSPPPPPPDPGDTTPPPPPQILSPVESAPPFTVNTVLFSGTAEANATLRADYLFGSVPTIATTTADTNGDWALALSLDQGTTTVDFTAIDSSLNESTSASRAVSVDSNAPDIILAPCGDSLATSGCLVATTTLNFSWSSNADDLDHFVINKNGTEETTTATSTEVTASDNSVYTFSVKAVDATGNESAPETQTVEIATTPIVINEIAWMGTDGAVPGGLPNDEWIELYNPTDKEISLAGWVLRAGDGTPTIGLTDTITAGGYYILERTDDTTVSDISANQIYGNDGASFALTNTGEELFLERVANGATTTIDKTPAGCSNWCNKGNNTTKQTMERIDARASGADSANWMTALGEFIRNGKDANGFLLNGTPKAKNSVSYLISANSSRTVTANKTLTAADSPYLIDRPGLTVNAGATLTLEAGTIVKIVNPTAPRISVEGNIVSLGIALNPVVFTSFKDDVYGGDMNSDGAATTPAPSDWAHIILQSTSAGSSFQNTLVRYAGTSKNGYEAGIVVDDVSPSFDAITVEYSNKYGLYLDGSSSTVTNSLFAYNGANTVNAAGIYVSGVAGGAVTLAGNTFQENDFGVWVQGAPTLTVSGNDFLDNGSGAAYISGAIGSFSGNTGIGNTPNALYLSGAFAFQSASLLSNALPYYIEQSFEVKASSTLTIAGGVVIKGHDNSGSIAGRIVVKPGASIVSNESTPAGIVFTSENDDSVGGDTNNDGAGVAPAAGDWYGITVENGGFLNLSGFTLRYAGGLTTQSGDDKGGIKITGDVASSTIANALFDSNYQYGAHVRSGGALTISNTTFQNHTNGKTADYAAVFVNNSFAALSDIIFGNNTKWDIRAFGADYSVSCTNCGTPATSPDPL